MSNLPLTYLAPDIAVAPQLEPDQLAAAAAQGFKSVINNRMPGEPGQPPQDVLRAAASAAGLRYEWQPVNPAAISPEDVTRFSQLLDSLPRPILAFCRSGSRSTTLFNAAMRQRAGTR